MSAAQSPPAALLALALLLGACVQPKQYGGMMQIDQAGVAHRLHVLCLLQVGPSVAEESCGPAEPAAVAAPAAPSAPVERAQAAAGPEPVEESQPEQVPQPAPDRAAAVNRSD